MSLGLVRGKNSDLALIDAASGRTLTYGDLRTRVRETAAALSSGDKRLVFLLASNDVASAVTYLAAIEAGHSVALLDARSDVSLLRALVDRYRPSFLVASGPSDAGHDPVGPEYEEAAGAAPEGARVLRRQRSPGDAIHPDLALLLSTSGTTGSPKLVRLSHRNLSSNAEAIAEYLGLSPGERAITSLPFPYSYGLSVLNSHLVAGGSVVFTPESILGAPFWDAFRSYTCTSFAGVPYSYEILLRTGFDRRDLPSLRTMTQAGGRMAPEVVLKLHRILKERGARLFVMYGQTEATARIAYLPPETLPGKAAAVGVAIPGGSLAIDAEGTLTTEPGVTGEVVYSGPNVMMGYATGPEDLAAPDQQGGRLATGDIGHFDHEGLLHITSRTKRISKLFGLRVSLDDLEQHLSEWGPVAVVGDDARITAYCAFGSTADHEKLRRALAERYKIHANAFSFRRVDEIPRKPSGKTDYGRLAEEGRDGHG